MKLLLLFLDHATIKIIVIGGKIGKCKCPSLLGNNDAPRQAGRILLPIRSEDHSAGNQVLVKRPFHSLLSTQS